MKAVRFTLGEAAAVRDLVEAAAREEADPVWDRVLTKLFAASIAPTQTSAGPIEAALVATSRGRVVKLETTGSVWARAARMAASVGATADGAGAVGAWLSRQSWLRGTLTVIDVLKKWPEWSAKARAEASAAGLPEGFDGDAGRSAPAQRGQDTRGRRPAPFG